MTNPTDPKLLHLLDAYGADQSRWPADAVRQFNVLTGSTPTDQALRVRAAQREAKALDQVLARASTVSAERQTALAERIMAKIRDDAGGDSDAASASNAASSAVPRRNVVALPLRAARPAQVRQLAAPPSPASAAPLRRGIDWRAAAALAAALVLGIGVGVSGGASPTFQAVAETVGVSLERSVLALNDEHGGAMAALDDEDVL
jgi:hypothetical protein